MESVLKCHSILMIWRIILQFLLLLLLMGKRWMLATWPKSQLLVSPRFGFNYDVKGDRSLQIRGGSGLFTGMLPFVWFTNQPTNSGLIQVPEIGWGTGNAKPCRILTFNPDYKAFIASRSCYVPAKPENTAK